MQRNFSVDTLRFLCAFMVILIHCDDHPWQPWYGGVTQLAVPCFFIISGYLCYSERKTATPRLLRSLKKITFVLVASALFYLPAPKSFWFVLS